MYLLLESKLIHVFEDVDLTADRLLRALTQLLVPSDKVLFGTYGSHQSVLEFWNRHALPSDPIIAEWDRDMKIWKNDEDKLDPKACAIQAEPNLLYELASIAANLDHKTSFLCDHLGAYCEDGALLSCHDAFGNPFHVSGDIPEERINRFRQELGIRHRVVPCHEVYDWMKDDA